MPQTGTWIYFTSFKLCYLLSDLFPNRFNSFPPASTNKNLWQLWSSIVKLEEVSKSFSSSLIADEDNCPEVG